MWLPDAGRLTPLTACRRSQEPASSLLLLFRFWRCRADGVAALNGHSLSALIVVEHYAKMVDEQCSERDDHDQLPGTSFRSTPRIKAERSYLSSSNSIVLTL